MDGHFGQPPVAGLGQTVKLFALGELSLDLGAFSPRLAGPSGSGVTGVQASSHPQGRQMGPVGLAVVGLVSGQLLGLGLGQAGQDRPVGDIPRGGLGLDDELGVGILNHVAFVAVKPFFGVLRPKRASGSGEWRST